MSNVLFLSNLILNLLTLASHLLGYVSSISAEEYEDKLINEEKPLVYENDRMGFYRYNITCSGGPGNRGGAAVFHGSPFLPAVQGEIWHHTLSIRKIHPLMRCFYGF